MNKEIVLIKASDYGMEESKAKQIRDMFTPMLDLMVSYEDEYNDIVSKEITPELCKEAGELRKKYVKVRTGTEKIHKELKAFYLNGGRFVDGWKNAQAFASQGLEQKLMSIERHYELIEEKRLADMHQERFLALQPYMNPQSPVVMNLSGMDQEAWNVFFEGMKSAHTKRIEEEKRIKDEAEKAEQERLKENARLKAENDILKLKNMNLEKANATAPNIDKGNQEIAKNEPVVFGRATNVSTYDFVMGWVDSFVIPEIRTDNISDEMIAKVKNIQEKFNSFKNWAKLQI